MVRSKLETFALGLIQSRYLSVFYRPSGCDELVCCRFDPESVCNRPLEELFDDIKYKLVRFRGKKGASITTPPVGETLFLSASFSIYHGCSESYT